MKCVRLKVNYNCNRQLQQIVINNPISRFNYIDMNYIVKFMEGNLKELYLDIISKDRNVLKHKVENIEYKSRKYMCIKFI